jgi:DNA-binding PadR family transcriptional regulator
MSLRHGLLGLLAEAPASGFDLTRRFNSELGTVWPASHPHIYAELGRLERDGMIELDSEGPRRRKAYRITGAGLDEIRRWLAAGPVDHTLRLEPLLRSYFFWLMEPDALAAHLEQERAFYLEKAAMYRGLAEAKDRGDFGHSTRTQSLRITVEAGIRLYEALAGWADWAAGHQPGAGASEPAASEPGASEPGGRRPGGHEPGAG